MKKLLNFFWVLSFALIAPISANAATVPSTYEFKLGSGILTYSGGNLHADVAVKSYTGPSIGSLTGLHFICDFQDDGSKDWKWDNGTISIIDSTKNTVLTGKTSGVGIDAENQSIQIPGLAVPITFTLGSVNSSFFVSDLSANRVAYKDSYFNLSFAALPDISFDKDFMAYVASGIVSGANPVPVPAAAWIFLTGIAGLAGLRRKNKK